MKWEEYEREQAAERERRGASEDGKASGKGQEKPCVEFDQGFAKARNPIRTCNQGQGDGLQNPASDCSQAVRRKAGHDHAHSPSRAAAFELKGRRPRTKPLRNDDPEAFEQVKGGSRVVR